MLMNDNLAYMHLCDQATALQSVAQLIRFPTKEAKVWAYLYIG